MSADALLSVPEGARPGGSALTGTDPVLDPTAGFGALAPDAAELLDLLTMGAADGITIQDARGRVVYANLAAAQLTGYASVAEFLDADPADRVGHWEMLTEDGEPFPVDELPGRRALLGEPQAEAVLRVRDRRNGAEFWSLVKATATFDD